MITHLQLSNLNLTKTFLYKAQLLLLLAREQEVEKMKAQKEKGLVGYMDHCKKNVKEQRLFPSLDNITTSMKKQR